MGLEIERIMPGGVQARWERDAIGRPLKQEVWAAGEFRRAVQYTWDVNDRLQMVVDATRGPTKFEHDAARQLWRPRLTRTGESTCACQTQSGNYFARRIGAIGNTVPAGQLLEAKREDGGISRYEYDAEGNLTKKVEGPATAHQSSDKVWHFRWKANGLLENVTRPDGTNVAFKYDAFARRLSKTSSERTTFWQWDRQQAIHEKVEQTGTSPAAGDSAEVVTWLFSPDTQSPLGKLTSTAAYALVTDCIGSPIAAFSTQGRQVWRVDLDATGGVRGGEGEAAFCPLRWPGQYADIETGLHYNRFRYYDPSVGTYISADMLGAYSRHPAYAYVSDPLTQFDGLGLEECGLKKGDPLPDDAQIHRIGGADAANLALKPPEMKLTPPGISVLRAGSPEEAAALAKGVAQREGWSRMSTAAETMGTATAADVRAAGFDVIHDPTKAFGDAHSRLIHPAGEGGFTPENLDALSKVFTNNGGL